MDVVSNPAPKRTPKDTEARLYNCALTLFAEKGYAATSVREIIEAAGVTRPVLYYYCRDKEELFSRIVEAMHRDANLGLLAVRDLPISPIDRLRAVIRGSFQFCAQDPRVPKLMFQAFFGPERDACAGLVGEWTQVRFGVIVQIISEGLQSGSFKGGTSESLALVFCSLMDHHINCLARLPEPASLLTQDLADTLLDIFLHGVCTNSPLGP